MKQLIAMAVFILCFGVGTAHAQHAGGGTAVAGGAGTDGRVGGAPHVNPAELQILSSRLSSIADEMGAVLRRSAFSPNISGLYQLLGFPRMTFLGS